MTISDNTASKHSVSDRRLEAELVSKAVEGDFSAFEELVRMTEARLYAHLLRLTNNQADASELLHNRASPMIVGAPIPRSSHDIPLDPSSERFLGGTIRRCPTKDAPETRSRIRICRTPMPPAEIPRCGTLSCTETRNSDDRPSASDPGREQW